MSTKMIRQTQFKTGEVDEIVWKRTDAKEYLSCAQSLKNCVVGTTGLSKKRNGSVFLLDSTAYTVEDSHTYSFVDKNQNFYLLLSDNEAFHIFSLPSITFISTIVTPYLLAHLDNIDYAQDNDTLVLTHPLYPPARIYISNYSPLTFSYQVLNIYPIAAYDFSTINYNNFTVQLSVAGTVLTFKFVGVGADPGFTNAWVGGQIIGGGSSASQPLGYAIITAVSYGAGGGGTVTFTANVQIPFETTNYATSGAQYSVRQPAWSAALGYPAKVLHYQNRLWLGGTSALNNTVFGSKINAPINFDVGTGADTDAIIYAIGQSNSGEILWLNGGKQLEVYTENYEFVCPQDENTALTPSTFSIRQQSAYGSSDLLKPLTYINDSYYCIKTGKAFINFKFNGVGLAYIATNITTQSSHLVKNPTSRALIRGSDTSQDNFIYFLNPTDDTITAFQFSGTAKLAALTPFEFQENIEIVDIVSIDNSAYILKKYILTNKYAIEKFDDELRIDSAQNKSMNSAGLITGLDILDGYTVQVVFQNQDFGQYLVEGGKITVDNPNELSGTATIGLLYNVEIIPMYLFSGGISSPFFKNISRIYVDYYLSLDFSINGKLVPYQNFREIQEGLPLTPKTDTAIVSPVSGWERFSTFSITQSSPFDLQILSIAYQIKDAVL